MDPTLLRAAQRVARLSPPALDRPIAGAAGRLWCAVDGRRRAAVHANRAALQMSHPDHAPFASYVEALLGWFRLLGARPEEILAASSVEGLDLVGSPRGTVLVAAHVGEWEWGAAALAARGHEVVAVSGVQLRPEWMPELVRAKDRLGISVVGADDAPSRLVRALRRGAIVALLVDGDVATARAYGTLGGRTAALPQGPARLAARTGARLVAGRCEREPGGRRYSIQLTALDTPLPGDSTPLDEPALFIRVAHWLDDVLRSNPGRWCIFRPFFAGEAA